MIPQLRAVFDRILFEGDVKESEFPLETLFEMMDFLVDESEDFSEIVCRHDVLEQLKSLQFSNSE